MFLLSFLKTPFINRFETHVVNTQQYFDDLQGKIFFEHLNLHGSNGGIRAQVSIWHFVGLSSAETLSSRLVHAWRIFKLQTV